MQDGAGIASISCVFHLDSSSWRLVLGDTSHYCYIEVFIRLRSIDFIDFLLSATLLLFVYVGYICFPINVELYELKWSSMLQIFVFSS